MDQQAEIIDFGFLLERKRKPKVVQIGECTSRLMQVETVEDFAIARLLSSKMVLSMRDRIDTLQEKLRGMMSECYVMDPSGAEMREMFDGLKGELREQILRFAPDLDEAWLIENLPELEQLEVLARELAANVWASVPEWLKKNSSSDPARS